MATTSVYLDDELLERLKAIAQKKDRSVSWIVSQVVLEFLKKEEKGKKL